VQAKAVLTDVYEDVSRQFFNDNIAWCGSVEGGPAELGQVPEAAKFKNVCADVKWSISGVTYNTNIVTPDIVPKTGRTWSIPAGRIGWCCPIRRRAGTTCSGR
jgi:hypothetical protein